MERYLIKLNDCPWFTMTMLPYHDAQQAAREVAMGGMPDWVVAVDWHARDRGAAA